jgi:hypothetical protein
VAVKHNYYLMKKILIAAFVILLVVLAGIYLFIPNKIILSRQLTVAANREALFRNLGASSNWNNWWPSEKMVTGENATFSLNGIQYQPLEQKVLSLPVMITSGEFRCAAEITCIAMGSDSTIIEMSGSMITSYNPLKRINAFFAAKKIKQETTALLQHIKNHYSSTLSLYQYDIQKRSVTDSTLLTNIKEIKGIPTTATIYSLVDELRAYIKQQDAHETGNPMLNIFTKDSISYLLKVAIPVDKKLPSSGTMSYRWMLGGGNILITEVKGGPEVIRDAYDKIQLYITDNHRIAPAIPFESLVTDRRQEPDSTKWITRIYYPVM